MTDQQIIQGLIYYTEGTFRTKVREADEEDPMKVHKIFHDGHILIQRAGKTYTVTGQELNL